MRPASFLRTFCSPAAFFVHKIADLSELKRVRGTDTDLTLFRKLRQPDYLATYTHRGRFYTLAESLASTIGDCVS